MKKSPEWATDLIAEVEHQITSSTFFARVPEVEPDRWVGQLVHQSSEFTRALSLRSSLCRDARFAACFAEHAAEEAQHPAQLGQWMVEHGITTWEPPTTATIDCMAFNWRAAIQCDPATQIGALNLAGECAALAFYTRVIPVLTSKDMMSGRYWKVHREVDSVHMLLGLDELAIGLPMPSPFDLNALRNGALGAACRYRNMLDSWID